MKSEVCSLSELIKGITVKTTLIFADGTEGVISQSEFKLVPDELGYVMYKNGGRYRIYADRVGAARDILSDFAGACIPDDTIPPSDRLIWNYAGEWEIQE